MNELALFSGAGGGILGGHLLGWRTVCAVEIEDYARRVLLQRQADGCLPRFPIWDDVCTFDGKPWRGKVDVISGGFPCQDISVAGKGAGIEGERSGLWSEFARIIGEVRPSHVFVENSPMLTVRGLDRVLGDLSSMGYDARWGVVGAVYVGAPHKRERIWIVATDPKQFRRHTRAGKEIDTWRKTSIHEESTDNRSPRPKWKDLANSASKGLEGYGTNARQPEKPESWNGGSLADASSEGLEGSEWEKFEGRRKRPSKCGEVSNFSDSNRYGCNQKWQSVAASSGDGPFRNNWWITEPDVGRVAHGVADRVHRLKAIGNGQVPAVAAFAWETLKH